jgi:hypothetical protein
VLLLGIERAFLQAGQIAQRTVLSLPWIIETPKSTSVPNNSAPKNPETTPAVAAPKIALAPKAMRKKTDASPLAEGSAESIDSRPLKPTQAEANPLEIGTSSEAEQQPAPTVPSPSFSSPVLADAAQPAVGPPTVLDAAAPAVKLPAALLAPVMPFEAVYLVFQGDANQGAVLGKTTLSLRALPGSTNGYQSDFIVNFNWVTRMLADDRSWSSTGNVTSAGLVPTKTIETRGKRPPKITTIDTSTLRATSGDTQFATVFGVQDRVSAIWQLGSMARSMPENFNADAQVQLPLLSHSKVTLSRWRVQHEAVTTDKRTVDALHLTRIDTRDDEIRFEFWLDKQAAMQPIKIRLTDPRGRVFELQKETS